MPEDCTLDTLLPELQLHLLFVSDTPDNLHNLIHASPCLYQVFLLNKENILSAMARQLFHPAVLPEALTFAKISQLKQPLSREDARSFSHIKPCKLREWEDETSSASESAALCKLASSVNYFVEDFARNTLPIMKAVGQSQDVEVLTEYKSGELMAHSRLSRSEIGRLQRAFCRFETYRYALARCSTALNHDNTDCGLDPSIDSEEQAILYLEKYADYQITEIHCVRDYIFRRLRGVCSQLESEAVDALISEDFEFDEKECDVECAELDSGLYLFTDSGKSWQKAHLEHLMSLGLPYIRQILESTGKKRRDLFIRHIPNAVLNHLETNFMTEAIERLGRNPARESMSLLADRPSEYEFHQEHELEVPEAWKWAYPDVPPILLRDSSLKGLRDWGFVFWDYERLQKSGILELDPEVVRRVKFDEYKAAAGPSVQERLCGPSSTAESDDDSYGDVDSESHIDDYGDSDGDSGLDGDSITSGKSILGDEDDTDGDDVRDGSDLGEANGVNIIDSNEIRDILMYLVHEAGWQQGNL